MLELEWEIPCYLTIMENDFDDMKDYANRALAEDEEKDKDFAIEDAVHDFLAGQDDIIFYGIPAYEIKKIENELRTKLNW